MNKPTKSSRSSKVTEFVGNVWTFFLTAGWQMSILDPKQLSAKILALSSLFLGMMMYSSYSGVLVSNIMVRRTDVAVNSFQEVMDTDHKIATYMGSIGMDMVESFKSTNPGISSNILYLESKETKDRLDYVRNSDKIVTLLPGEDFAKHYIKKQKGKCELGRSKTPISSSDLPYAFAVNKEGFRVEGDGVIQVFQAQN
ncbi:uncharacterized protein LOC111708282 [Eurytemora carolleeae]|uniref:uncharacterized protein LOC111708282 n=1 Tax=Eurytemora carolleeae TaxID=1294199 RepID=UPI000C772378|nr:uncharacterized protein LOC111708282 [Eurytemora carolleeae]|eukprot:XP_023337371.1 uncharacterized protein LOC111708282 [Eurytemora affinis]